MNTCLNELSLPRASVSHLPKCLSGSVCYRESEASLSRPEVSRSGLWKGLSMNIECEVNPKCRRVLECLSINHNIVCEVNADVSVEVSLNEHRV